jgi:hypothetical protein
MRKPSRNDQGLRAGDARPVVDVECDHPAWNVLTKDRGCIHSDHGPYPYPTADHHTGHRLVAGVPTRYLPRRASL